MLTLDEVERAAYITGDTQTVALLGRMENEMLDGLVADREAELEKEHEVVDEQSESRRAVLEEIVEICARASRNSRFKETKEIASSILQAVSDSYVEL